MTEDSRAKIQKLKKLIEACTFGKDGIYEFIPQRPPFLMLDDVIKLDIESKKVICKKKIMADEWYLAGHFPGNPVMPGVLMVEGMAQAASIIGRALSVEEEGVLLFASIDECHFSGMATVNDILIIEATVTKIRGPLVVGECCVKKDEQIIANCKLKAFRKTL